MTSHNGRELDLALEINLTKRGDWCLTRKRSSRVQCFEYTAPFPRGKKVRDENDHKVVPLPPDHWFGPVHDVMWPNEEEENVFVSVQVPSHIKHGELVWVNIRGGPSGQQPFIAALDRKWAGFLD